jgi:LytS/YehU family sensor histidine kinase
VEWDVDPSLESVRVPPFSVQILVENAVNHGVASQPESGIVRISARPLPGRALVAVSDDGLGMSEGAKKDALSAAPPNMHGLPILNQQLLLLYGRRARLRLFSRSDAGTLAAFAVPIVGTKTSVGVRRNAESADSRR